MRKEISTTGTIRYYNENDELHREGGPAVEYMSGTKVWYVNGKRHRLDGPSFEYFDNQKLWYLNDNEIPVNSQEEFERYLKLIVFV